MGNKENKRTVTAHLDPDLNNMLILESSICRISKQRYLSLLLELVLSTEVTKLFFRDIISRFLNRKSDNDPSWLSDV